MLRARQRESGGADVYTAFDSHFSNAGHAAFAEIFAPFVRQLCLGSR